MFSIIRNTLTTKAERATACTEISPDTYLDRAAAIRSAKIREVCGLLALAAMGAAFAFAWLAYEGIITPETFK